MPFTKLCKLNWVLINILFINIFSAFSLKSVSFPQVDSLIFIEEFFYFISEEIVCSTSFQHLLVQEDANLFYSNSEDLFKKCLIHFWNERLQKNLKVNSGTISVMPWSLHHPTCIFSHIEYMLALIQLRKETQIKLILINFLQLFSCVMVWSLNYRTASPYVSTVLGILSIVTLGWLALCQQKHIEKLGKIIVTLCMQSAFNNPDEDDRISLNGQHWS